MRSYLKSAVARPPTLNKSVSIVSGGLEPISSKRNVCPDIFEYGGCAVFIVTKSFEIEVGQMSLCYVKSVQRIKTSDSRGEGNHANLVCDDEFPYVFQLIDYVEFSIVAFEHPPVDRCNQALTQRGGCGCLPNNTFRHRHLIDDLKLDILSLVAIGFFCLAVHCADGEIGENYRYPSTSRRNPLSRAMFCFLAAHGSSYHVAPVETDHKDSNQNQARRDWKVSPTSQAPYGRQNSVHMTPVERTVGQYPSVGVAS